MSLNKIIKHRWFLRIVLFSVVLIVGMLLTERQAQKELRDIRKNTRASLEVFAGRTLATWGVFSKAVGLMGHGIVFSAALADPSSDNIAAANKRLDEYNVSFQSSVAYLMDATGTVIASSNRNMATSFMGKNYAIRPYFQQAMVGERGKYVALGLTSGQIGYYVSAAVAGKDGKIIGAVVMKKDLDPVRLDLRAYPYAFLIDQKGVVFGSSQSDFLLKSLWPLDSAANKDLAATLQFGHGPFVPLFARRLFNGDMIARDGKSYYVSIMPLEDYGWSAVILGDMERVLACRLSGFGITLFAGFFLVLALLLVAARQQSQSDAMERFLASIVEGSADAIYSLDLAGDITSWNKAAEQVFGYSAEEIIGKSSKQLIPVWRQDELAEILEQSRQGERINQLETVRQAKNGRIINVSVTMAPLRDDRKGVVGISTISRDITEKKNTEKMLEEQKERLTAAMDMAVMGYWEYDIDSKLLVLSEQSWHLLGVAETPFEGGRILLDEFVRDYCHPDEATSVRDEFGSMNLASPLGVPFEVDLRLIKVDGKEIDTHHRYHFIRSLDGKSMRTFGMMQDITLRKDIERGLRDEQQKARQYLEVTHSVIIVLDIKGRVLLMNRKALETLGWDLLAVTGRNWLETFVLEEDRAPLQADFEQQIQNEIVVQTQENRILCRNGEEIRFAWSSSLVRDRQGLVSGTILAGEDITDRRQMEEDLKLFFRAVEQSSTVVMITDVQGIIHYVNPQFTRLTGYEANEVYGQKPQIQSSHTHTKEFYITLWTSILAGKEWRGEFRNRKKNGEEYWENAVISPVKDPVGRITHFIAVKEDITERKRQEALKEGFVSMVSHELRTPLAAIKESIKLVIDGLVGSVTPQTVGILEIGNRNVDRLARLINDVLDLQKMRTGVMPLTIAMHSMPEVVTEVCASMLPVAAHKGLTMVVEAADIPSFCFDRDRIIQVITNFVNNAIKFTAAGGIRLVVALEGVNAVRVSIIDTGLGIAREDLDKLFISFSQLSAGKKKTGSSGLGLAISREIVAKHGGKTGVESTLGLGSSFYFVLPLQERRDGSRQEGQDAAQDVSSFI